MAVLTPRQKRSGAVKNATSAQGSTLTPRQRRATSVPVVENNTSIAENIKGYKKDYLLENRMQPKAVGTTPAASSIKTPLDSSRYNIFGSSILPRYKEDKPLAAIGKDTLNYGLGTVGRIFGAPQQAIMQADRAAINAATGNKQDFSQMSFGKDILGQKNDNFATMAAATLLDPTTYIGGGILDDMARAGQFGKGAVKGTTENLIATTVGNQKALKGIPIKPQEATRTYLKTEKNIARNGAKNTKTPDVINAGQIGQPTQLALPAPAKREPFTQVKYSTMRKPVQDENTLYHGTNANFKKFDTSKIGTNSGNEGFYGKGIYLTNDKAKAGFYGDKIKNVVANFKKPFIIDGNTSLDEIARLAETTPVAETKFKLINDVPETIMKNPDVFTNNLKKLGYDGIVVGNKNEVVAFYPEQLKPPINKTRQVGQGIASVKTILPKKPQQTLFNANPNIEQPFKATPGELPRKVPTANANVVGRANTPLQNKVAQNGAQAPIGTLPKKTTAPLSGQSKFAQTVANSKNTTQQVAEDLKKLDLGYDVATNKQSLEQANRRIAANPEDAVRFVLDTKVPSAEHTTTAIQLINKFQNEGNYERAVDIASDISSKLTKNGQAIQAASIYDRLSPEGILLYAQRQVNKLNDARWFKGLTKEQKINPDLAKQLKELSENMKNLTGDAKVEASQELQQVLQALGKSTVLRKIESAQTIGQLLNPKTIIRNIVGNEIFYRVERLNKYVATPIDIARSTLTGADRTITFKKGGQGGYWEGFFKGVKAGWKGVNPSGLTTQFDLTSPAFKGKWNPLTYMEKTLGATLKGFDYAAYNRAVNQTIGEMAELKAMNQGLSGAARKVAVQDFIKNTDKNILDIADQYGKYVTFQDDNVLSKGFSAIKRGLNLGKEWGVGSLVVKYPRTPGALMMRGLEYSPAGFLKSAYEIAKPLLKGGKIDTKEATMALSRAITGTLGFTGLGYYLADNGVITGRTDKDADVRGLQQQMGAGSYKVNLSALKRWAISGFDTSTLQMQDGDTLYSYDWAQPIAMAISFGANINTNLKENKGALDSTGATIASSMEGALGTIAEQPVLQGITRLFQGYDLGQNVTQTLKGIPSSFTPTFANQVRQFKDNAGRSTYNPDPLKSALNMAQVKIPGLSGKLPTTYDTLGKQKENYQNGSNNFFNVFLNPGFVSKNNPTSVQKEVLRLFDATSLKTQFPAVADKSFTWKDFPKFTLSETEYPQFQKVMGEETQRLFTEEMGKEEYNTMNDEEKAKKLSSLISDARDAAKYEFLKGRGLAHNPLIMNVPSSLTKNKIPIKLTLDQQSDLADAISAKQQKFKDFYKAAYTDKRAKEARAKAEEEFKRTLK